MDPGICPHPRDALQHRHRRRGGVPGRRYELWLVYEAAHMDPTLIRTRLRRRDGGATLRARAACRAHNEPDGGDQRIRRYELRDIGIDYVGGPSEP